MRIFMFKYDFGIASDHAGIGMKSKIVDYLVTQNKKILDLGPINHESVDYPDYADKLVESVNEEIVTQGILICGTGIGMSIAANRYSYIRAALCINENMAEYAKRHNNANILVLGSKLITDDESLKIVHKFLYTSFEGGRHSRRLAKIS